MLLLLLLWFGVRLRERVRRRVVEDEDGGEESGSGEERGFFSIIE
jgi:uncharacterized membrane protein